MPASSAHGQLSTALAGCGVRFGGGRWVRPPPTGWVASAPGTVAVEPARPRARDVA